MNLYNPLSQSHARAQKVRPSAYWIFASLLGLALWAAHFGRATRFDGSNYPPMGPTVELMLNYGRIFALFCMISALAFYINRFGRTLSLLISGPSAWIAALNGFLSLKLLFYGYVDFFLSAAAMIVLSVFVFSSALRGVEETNFRTGNNGPSAVVLSLWLCGALIVLCNVAALILYPDSVTSSNPESITDAGRMHGLTTNPQHLAMMCALVVPAFLYTFFCNGIRSFIGLVSIVLFAGAVAIEFYTGSRMGFLAVAIGSIVFFRAYLNGKIIIAIILIALVVAMFLPVDMIQELIYGRFVEGREDSRSEVWTRAWQLFLEDPVLGTEPDETGRLRGVESVFLSAAMSGGIVGVALCLRAIIGLVIVLLSLQLALRRGGVERAICNFYLSSIAILLILCTFEAAILGIFATHTFIAYLVLSGAKSLEGSVRISRIRTASDIISSG